MVAIRGCASKQRVTAERLARSEESPPGRPRRGSGSLKVRSPAQSARARPIPAAHEDRMSVSVRQTVWRSSVTCEIPLREQQTSEALTALHKAEIEKW